MLQLKEECLAYVVVFGGVMQLQYISVGRSAVTFFTSIRILLCFAHRIASSPSIRFIRLSDSFD